MLRKSSFFLVLVTKSAAASSASASTTTVAAAAAVVSPASSMAGRTPVTSTQQIGGGADSVLSKDWAGTGEFFCRLCAEPFNQWNEHRGKRDHICLELFYNVICEQARSWNAHSVASEHEVRFASVSHGSSSSSSSSSPSCSQSCAERSIRSMFRHMDFNQLQRRNRIFALVRHLQERGVIYLGPSQWRDGRLNKIQMGQTGAVAMFLAPHPQIIHLFPKADAAQIASFSQACYNQYSLETVFDFLGLGELLDPREMQQQQASTSSQGGDAAVASSPNTGSSGASASPTSGATSAANNSASKNSTTHLHWQVKAIMIRNILGQIRFAMEDGHKLNHPIAKLVGPHEHVLCEELATCLITEILFVRAVEFVTRAEKVWRSHGCPTVALPFPGTVRDITHGGIMPAFEYELKKALAARSGQAVPRAGGETLPSSNAAQSLFVSRSSPVASTWNNIRRPPGTTDHLPTPQTENAVHMINACYHSAMATLFGNCRGDVADRSGGEAFMEMEQSLKATVREHMPVKKQVVVTLKRHWDDFLSQPEKKTTATEKAPPPQPAAASKSTTSAAATIALKARVPYLSPAAERLQLQASGLKRHMVVESATLTAAAPIESDAAP